MIPSLLAALLLALAAVPAQQEPAVAGDDSATYRPGYGGLANAVRVYENPARARWQKPRAIVDSLRVRPGARVADIGAGTGYFNALFAAAVGDSGAVFAVEIRPELVAYMQDRAEREVTPQVRPILGTPDDPELPVGLDLIFLCNTYRYIDGRRAYFAGLRGHLSARGRLAVVDFKRFPQDTTARRILPEQVIEELDWAGYALVERFDFLPKQFFLVFAPRADDP